MSEVAAHVCSLVSSIFSILNLNAPICEHTQNHACKWLLHVSVRESGIGNSSRVFVYYIKQYYVSDGMISSTMDKQLDI